jgi:hypothetical protein
MIYKEHLFNFLRAAVSRWFTVNIYLTTLVVLFQVDLQWTFTWLLWSCCFKMIYSEQFSLLASLMTSFVARCSLTPPLPVPSPDEKGGGLVTGSETLLVKDLRSNWNIEMSTIYSVPKACENSVWNRHFPFSVKFWSRQVWTISNQVLSNQIP